MSIQRKHLNIFYMTMGLLAWGLTSLHLPNYFSLGLIQGTVAFWQDALFNTNSAGKFLTVDILLLALAVISWMLIEARQRNLRFVWIYILIGVFIGISLAAPLFMAAREREIVRQNPQDDHINLTRADTLGLAMLTLMTLAAATMTLL